MYHQLTISDEVNLRKRNLYREQSSLEIHALQSGRTLTSLQELAVPRET